MLKTFILLGLIVLMAWVHQVPALAPAAPPTPGLLLDVLVTRDVNLDFLDPPCWGPYLNLCWESPDVFEQDSYLDPYPSALWFPPFPQYLGPPFFYILLLHSKAPIFPSGSSYGTVVIGPLAGTGALPERSLGVWRARGVRPAA